MTKRTFSHSLLLISLVTTSLVALPTAYASQENPEASSSPCSSTSTGGFAGGSPSSTAVADCWFSVKEELDQKQQDGKGGPCVSSQVAPLASPTSQDSVICSGVKESEPYIAPKGGSLEKSSSSKKKPKGKEGCVEKNPLKNYPEGTVFCGSREATSFKKGSDECASSFEGSNGNPVDPTPVSYAYQTGSSASSDVGQDQGRCGPSDKELLSSADPGSTDDCRSGGAAGGSVASSTQTPAPKPEPKGPEGEEKEPKAGPEPTPEGKQGPESEEKKDKQAPDPKDPPGGDSGDSSSGSSEPKEAKEPKPTPSPNSSGGELTPPKSDPCGDSKSQGSTARPPSGDNRSSGLPNAKSDRPYLPNHMMGAPPWWKWLGKAAKGIFGGSKSVTGPFKRLKVKKAIELIDKQGGKLPRPKVLKASGKIAALAARLKQLYAELIGVQREIAALKAQGFEGRDAAAVVQKLRELLAKEKEIQADIDAIKFLLSGAAQ